MKTSSSESIDVLQAWCQVHNMMGGGATYLSLCFSFLPMIRFFVVVPREFGSCSPMNERMDDTAARCLTIVNSSKRFKEHSSIKKHSYSTRPPGSSSNQISLIPTASYSRENPLPVSRPISSCPFLICKCYNIL